MPQHAAPVLIIKNLKVGTYTGITLKTWEKKTKGK